MPYHVVALAASPRRHGNSEELLDSALCGVSEAAPDAEIAKFILNDLNIRPCQNCGCCERTGECVFDKKDDMGDLRAALDRADRIVVASPIFFANVSAQLKIVIDRCQVHWARKKLLGGDTDTRDRRMLFLCCGGFEEDKFSRCTRQVVGAWCVCMDVKLQPCLFFMSVDAKGDIEKHPTALSDAFEAGKRLAGELA